MLPHSAAIPRGVCTRLPETAGGNCLLPPLRAQTQRGAARQLACLRMSSYTLAIRTIARAPRLSLLARCVRVSRLTSATCIDEQLDGGVYNLEGIMSASRPCHDRVRSRKLATAPSSAVSNVPRVAHTHAPFKAVNAACGVGSDENMQAASSGVH
eukprot:2812733-Pleurochrysis_carterae.AAC.2